MLSRRELLAGGLALIGSKLIGSRVLGTELEKVRWGVEPQRLYPFTISLLDKVNIEIPQTKVDILMTEAADFHGLIYPEVHWEFNGRGGLFAPGGSITIAGWAIGRKDFGTIGKFGFDTGDDYCVNAGDTLNLCDIKFCNSEEMDYAVFRKLLGFGG